MEERFWLNLLKQFLQWPDETCASLWCAKGPYVYSRNLISVQDLLPIDAKIN